MSRVVVFHAYQGCESGCCGHTVEIGDDETFKVGEHPHGEDPRIFAESLVRQVLGDDHVRDLDWANSVIVDD